MGLNLRIEDKDRPGYFENTEFIVSKDAENSTSCWLDELKKNDSVLFFVNERKVLLNQIYKNLFLELKEYIDVEVEYIDNTKAGIFSNYQSPYFREPSCVLIILTKKHNNKELNLLKELKKRKDIKVFVLVLAAQYYYPDFNLLYVDKIRSLYTFMYSLLNKRKYYNYQEFSKLFKFEAERFNFL